MKKITLLILCFALLSSLLSCQTNDKKPTETTAAPQDVWQIEKDQLVIVRSEDATSSVVQELRNLKKDSATALS